MSIPAHCQILAQLRAYASHLSTQREALVERQLRWWRTFEEEPSEKDTSTGHEDALPRIQHAIRLIQEADNLSLRSAIRASSFGDINNQREQFCSELRLRLHTKAAPLPQEILRGVFLFLKETGHILPFLDWDAVQEAVLAQEVKEPPALPLARELRRRADTRLEELYKKEEVLARLAWKEAVQTPDSIPAREERLAAREEISFLHSLTHQMRQLRDLDPEYEFRTTTTLSPLLLIHLHAMRKELSFGAFLNLVVQHLYPDDFRSAAPFIDTLRAIPALET